MYSHRVSLNSMSKKKNTPSPLNKKNIYIYFHNKKCSDPQPGGYDYVIWRTLCKNGVYHFLGKLSFLQDQANLAKQKVSTVICFSFNKRSLNDALRKNEFLYLENKSTKKILKHCFSCQNKSVCPKLAWSWWSMYALVKTHWQN